MLQSNKQTLQLYHSNCYTLLLVEVLMFTCRYHYTSYSLGLGKSSQICPRPQTPPSFWYALCNSQNDKVAVSALTATSSPLHQKLNAHFVFSMVDTSMINAQRYSFLAKDRKRVSAVSSMQGEVGSPHLALYTNSTYNIENISFFKVNVTLPFTF